MAAIFQGCSASPSQFSSGWCGGHRHTGASRRSWGQESQCSAALRSERSWRQGLDETALRAWPLAAALLLVSGAPPLLLQQRGPARRHRRHRRAGAAHRRPPASRGSLVRLAAGLNDEAICVALDDVTVRRGREDILCEVDLAVPRGARAVVVGPNGCGKTTLLTTVAKKSSVDSGAMRVNAASIGWLRQEAVSGSKRTVLEEAKSEMRTAAIEQELAAAEAALMELDGAGDDQEELQKAQAAYDAVTTRYEAANGYAAEAKVVKVLEGLGFGPSDFKRSCAELSGGWQMKVALARALLQEPELLLLDEPTNHMDAAAKRWLADYLARGLSGHVTMLLVTHDRSLLEDISCTHVLEISAKKIVPYDCDSIQAWEGERKSRVAKLKKEMDKLEKEMKADQDYYRKWGAKASHATLAQSRMKKMERSGKQLEELREACVGLPSVAEVLGKGRQKAPTAPSDADGVLPLAGPGRVRLQLPSAPLASTPPTNGVLLSCMDAEVGYADSPPVLQQVRVELTPGSRMALLGPNGCGKTTLLRTLAGTMKVKSGRYKVGAGDLRRAKVRLFTQDLAQDLPFDQTPLEYLLGDDAPIMLDEEGARKALGALGLRAECHKSQIGNLSGGEKARVALAVFTTRPSDVLLLDEPTNHLDGAAVVALSQGLREHATGAVVVASHDRAFIDALDVTATATIVREQLGEPAQFDVVAGKPPKESATVPSAVNRMAAHEVAEEPEPARAPPPRRVTAGKARYLARKAMYKAEELMKKIEKREEEVMEAEEAMNTDWSQDKFDACEKIKQELERMYAKWEKLSEEAMLVA